jgi:hypothetical protein
VRLTSRGSPPLDLSLWEKTAFSPVPVVLKLTPIENILTEENLKADPDYGILADINAAAVIHALAEGLNQNW